MWANWRLTPCGQYKQKWDNPGTHVSICSSRLRIDDSYGIHPNMSWKVAGGSTHYQTEFYSQLPQTLTSSKTYYLNSMTTLVELPLSLFASAFALGRLLTAGTEMHIEFERIVPVSNRSQ